MREHPIPKTQCRDYTQFGPKSCCGRNTAYRKTNDRKMPGKRANSGANRPKMPEIARKPPLTAKSDVQQVVAGEFGLVGDEGEPGLGLGAHQPLDRIGGAFAVVGQQHHAEQRAPGRVHGGFLELGRHHLAKPFKAADIDLGVGVELALQKRVLVGVVAGVDRLAAVGQLVQRRHRQIEMPLVD